MRFSLVMRGIPSLTWGPGAVHAHVISISSSSDGFHLPLKTVRLTEVAQVAVVWFKPRGRLSHCPKDSLGFSALGMVS